MNISINYLSISHKSREARVTFLCFCISLQPVEVLLVNESLYKRNKITINIYTYTVIIINYRYEILYITCNKASF